MSEQTDEVVSQEPTGGELRSKLELSIEAAKQAKAEADALKRELAFAKVPGLDLEKNELHKTLAESYNGDLDPAAVRSHFERLGVLTGGQQDTTQTQANALVHNRMDAFSQGAEPATITGSDEQAVEAIMNATNVDEFYAALNSAGYAKR